MNFDFRNENMNSNSSLLIQFFFYFCLSFCFAKSSIVFAFETCVFDIVNFVALFLCRVAKSYDSFANDVFSIFVCFVAKQIRYVCFQFLSTRRQ